MERLKYLLKEFDNIDFHISDEKLREILSYRERAIPYLTEKLADTIDNYWQYDDSECFVAYHALLLLAELEADDAFPTVLRFHLQDEDILRFWLWDEWPTYGTYSLARLGHNHLQECMAALNNPQHNRLTRRMFSAALGRMSVIYPDIRKPILENYRPLLRNEQDASLLSSVVVDLLDCYGKELEADIHTAYDQARVEEQLCPRSEVEFMPKDLQKPPWDLWALYAELRRSHRFDSPHSPDYRQ